MSNIKTKIAILITCFNRKEKTLSCLESVFSQTKPGFEFTVYLIDNGSDGTAEEVGKKFPDVNLFYGDKSLYWAVSMRKIWQNVINTLIDYNYFLLLNDDTILINTALEDLMHDIDVLSNRVVILVGSTIDPLKREISYGGNILLNKYGSRSKLVTPNNKRPQICHLGNGNIMLIPKEVVDKLGILSDLYSHGLADFDYTLRALKLGIPSYIASNYLGYCSNDHGNKWWPAKNYTLKQRIEKLYSVKGLAYKEYILYLKQHFPYYLPFAWSKLWIKTFFPFFWSILKKDKKDHYE